MSRKYKEIKNHYKLKSCAKNRNYELKFGFGQATLKCCQGGRLSEGNVQRVPNISSKVYYLRYRYKYLSLSFIKSPDHRVRFLQCFRYKLRTITYRIIILPNRYNLPPVTPYYGLKLLGKSTGKRKIRHMLNQFEKLFKQLCLIEASVNVFDIISMSIKCENSNLYSVSVVKSWYTLH